MKLHYSALALAVYLGTAAAQGMDGLPACARDCATSSIPKSCNLIDVTCICSNKSFITDISCCVAKACGADQQQAAIDFANQICRTGGVTDLPQAASCSGTQSSATETSGASTGTSTASKSTGTASGASATTTGASTATGTDVSETGTGSSATAASPSATTGAAALLHGKDTGVLAGVGAALFAFLA